ncbi:Ig-like domain-containing protein, partial [Alteromonas confluentis]|uniref:Ig-like domain-containing protein n=2 Tax=Alteromonas confluentis TaxID=1656094 RepID=UPI001480D496
GEVDTAAPTVTVDPQNTGNDATPTVSGSTDLPAGETVSITVTDANGDAQTFTATVQPDGSFSADVPADLADGAYTVDVTATDAAGNTTTATEAGGEVDTSAPTVTVDPQNTGNDVTPTVSGTTDLPAGETVSITVTDANGDAQTFTATVQPDGSFSADVPADLAEGAYTVDVTATDAAGNATTATEAGGEVNTAAPSLSLDPQSPDSDTTPTVSGTTDLPAGETVSITVTDANGDAQTFTATVQPDGTFSTDVPTDLAEGAYTVEASATDASGNTATTTEVGGEVDTTAPTVTLDAQTTDNDATPTVSGTTDLPAGETVSITVTDANGDAQTFTATVQPDGSFSADVPADMADGAYTVEATATDAAGNATTATDNNGEVDTTAPNVTLDAQTTGNDATPTVSGTTDLPVGETISITVTDSNGDAQTFTATVQPDGSFSADVPADMADGAYTVDATATDAAGNATTATDNNGEIDTAAPTVTLDAQSTGNDATPTVSGTTDLPVGETVSITVTDANGDAQTFTATVQPDGSFSADVPADMADGAYTVEATATDAAGNATTATDNNGEIDTAAPTITLDAQTTGNDATPTVSGTTDLPVGETVSITVTDANGDAQTFTATVQPDGSFSADVPADMADGAYTVDVTATDAAGNATTATDNNGEIDTAAPTITLDAQSTGNDATPTVSGTTDLPVGETVSITVTDANGDAQTFTATVQPDGTFSADVPADMADGAYTVEATATDAAGNATTATDNNGEIDTAAPTVTLDPQNTGNDATPTVSGTTDLPVGETVSITVTDANGDAQTFTATVQPDGSFSADVPADMADGAYTVDATATDAAGNATTATDNNGEIDTAAPTVTLDPQNTGNDATPTVSGTTDLPVGETVSITVTDANGDAQTFTATVQPDGSFSADVPADMADGAYTVEVTASDAVGNTTTATDINGEIDTVDPTLTLDTQTLGNDATPTVSGTTDLPVGETVSITVTDANGDAQTFTATVQPDGSFSTDVPADMADGPYTVDATATDAAGNATTATDNNGEIDTAAPTITLDAQATGNDATPTVSGTTDLPVGETVSITVTDSNGDAQTFTATVQPDGSFSADVPADMADGVYTVEATATDAAGNATTATDNNGEIDTAAPTVTVDPQNTGNDATPTVSGTTDLPTGETISITVTDANGDAQIFTATVQPDGSFSADVPADIAEGAYTVEATATDAAGNTTSTTDNGGVLNTAAPSLTLDPQSPDTDTTPTISGSTDLPAGDTVSITVTDANGDAQTFTATVQPDGTFSADVPTALAEGAYTVEATATDASGNTATTTEVGGEVDTTAPTITLDAQTTGNDATPTVSGTTDLPVGETVSITVTDANGDAQTFTATVQPDGTFSADVPADMADGAYTVEATATDAAGNATTATDNNGEIDTAAPTITLDAQTTGNDATPTVSGTTDLPAGETVSITVTDANGDAQTFTATVQPDGSFSADVPADMADGAYTVEATATDAAGNATTATDNNGEIDTAAPTITLDAQTTGNDATPTVSGSTDLPVGETVSITVTDANGDAQTFTATVQPDGTFSADVPADMADGAYTVEATATDAAGNATTATDNNGEIDTAAPTVTLDAQTTGNDATPTVSGSSDLPVGETVSITVTDANGDAQTFTATVQPDGSFSADVPADMADGAYTVKATATDAAGNATTATDNNGEIDTAAPIITLDAQTTGNDATPTVSGSTDLPVGETVSITVTDANGDAQTFTATVQPDGSFSADVPADMADGAYTVEATATDAAGNATTATDNNGEIDTAAPVITLDPHSLGNDATPTVSGTTDLPVGETVSITVTDANGDAQTFTATVQPDGSFSADVPADMADGAYTVEATATDAAGNATTATDNNGEIDTAAPTITLDAQTTGNDATPTVSGSTDLPVGETVSITVTDANGDAQTFTATVQPDGSFSADVPADMADGAYTVEATATDAAGNATTATDNNGEIDTAAPTITLDAQTMGNDATPTVSGTTDLPVGETVSITVTDANGDAQTFTATVQPDGS